MRVNLKVMKKKRPRRENSKDEQNIKIYVNKGKKHSWEEIKE